MEKIWPWKFLLNFISSKVSFARSSQYWQTAVQRIKVWSPNIPTKHTHAYSIAPFQFNIYCIFSKCSAHVTNSGCSGTAVCKDLPNILLERSTGRQLMKSLCRLTPDTDLEDPGTTIRAGSSDSSWLSWLLLWLLTEKIRHTLYIPKIRKFICWCVQNLNITHSKKINK